MIGEALCMIWDMIVLIFKFIFKIGYKILPVFIVLLILWVVFHFILDIKIWWNIGRNPNTRELFVSHREKMIKENTFQAITLPPLDNYDIEIAIPSGQILHNTVQGNWGISTDPNNIGMTTGVYRDGYSADGCIFKGISGKKYKRMLEQGPYVLRYAIRNRGKSNNNFLENNADSITKSAGHDVKIYINDKLIYDLKNEGVPSDKLKVVGTNYADYNKLAEDTSRGRRPVDYIKFIPREKPKAKVKEGFSSNNKGLMGKISQHFANIFDGLKFKISYKEGYESKPEYNKEEYMKEKIRKYFWDIKNDNRKAILASRINNQTWKIYIRELFDYRWTGWDRCLPLAFYKMHMDIANGETSANMINLYAKNFTDEDILQDTYYTTTGERVTPQKFCKDDIKSEIAKELGFVDSDGTGKLNVLNAYLEKALRKIKGSTFSVSREPIGATEDGSADNAGSAGGSVGGSAGGSAGGSGDGDSETVVVPGGTGNKKCPKNCIEPRHLSEYCEKDIIRMVLGGEDKYYRKCPRVCKDRNSPDYINYDQSNAKNPFDVNRDGCRNTEAHCIDSCDKVLVEVDENGRDLYSIQNNYTKTKETTNYAKDRLFAHKQTNGLFGLTDNRLGGSKQKYTIKYKPENPNPAQGPVHYNAIWDFKS